MANSGGASSRDSAGAPPVRRKAGPARPATAPSTPSKSSPTPAPTGTSLGELGVRRKAVIGANNDPAERHADQVADRVMRSPAPGTAAPKPAASATPEIRRAPTTDTDASGGEAPVWVEQYLKRSAGGGVPLADDVRRDFEAQLNARFRDVRIHIDDEADRAAREIGARAFTRGFDIYFATGEFDPRGQEGRRLLAHELAHVLQARDVISRAAKKTSAKPTGSTAKLVGQDVVVENVEVTAMKSVVMAKEPPYVLRSAKEREKIDGKRQTTQVSKWEAEVSTRATEHTKHLLKIPPSGAESGTAGPHIVRIGTSSEFLVGDVSSIAKRMRRPTWDRNGKPGPFEVDHRTEWVLGGDDAPSNYWLSPADDNHEAGRTVWLSITRALSELAKQPGMPTVAQLLDREVTVESTIPAISPTSDDKLPLEGWSKTRDFDAAPEVSGLTKGLHLQTDADIGKQDLKGRAGKALSLYRNVHGGAREPVEYSGTRGDTSGIKSKKRQITLSTSDGIVFNGPSGEKGKALGYVGGELFVENKVLEKSVFTAPIRSFGDIDFYGGYIGTQKGDAAFSAEIRAKMFSPIELVDVELDLRHGLIGRGIIPKPSIKLLENVQFAVIFDEDGVSLSALVSAGAITLPGPFQITGGDIEIRANDSGVAVSGAIGFQLGSLATGRIGAKAGNTSKLQGFELFGEVNFDSKTFDPAELKLGYRRESLDADGILTASGRLGIGKGKVPGIRSALLEASMEGENLSVKGTVEPDLPGVEKGELAVTSDPKNGLQITGTVTLGKIPGVKPGAKIDAALKQRADGSGYSLSGAVVAQPDVPGLTGEITGDYVDGVFAVNSKLAYDKGFAKGSLDLLLTNQTIGPDGKPTGKPAPELSVSGGGTVTLRLTPWLSGTVGLVLQPNGEIVVTGQVGLPNSLEVFAEKAFDKQLFAVGIDIPIVGVSAAGQHIGIFATVSGGLRANAGIGPGVFDQLGLSVTYNPSREADTKVTGRARFVVPAHAGLVLFVRGGLGAGIPIVSASAGLVASGELGLVGAFTTDVPIEWTPSRGLVLEVRPSLYVEPKLRFALKADVKVVLDYLIDSAELYKREWDLASFEYGSSMRFGISFPMRYEEGKPFQISTDSIEYTVPHIDPLELIGGLVKQIVGE